MNNQPTSEHRDVQTAAQAVEACAHLSAGEKAALLAAIDELEKKLIQKDVQLQRPAASERTQTNLLEKTLTELAEQKALGESLSRELQIELALEEIRARAMAMLQADELYEVVTLVLEKLQALGITMQARSAFIAIFDESRKELIEWVASPEHSTSLRFTTPYNNHPVSVSVWEARQRGDDFVSRSFTVEEKNSFFDYYFQHVCCTNQLDHVKQLVYASDHYAYYIAFEQNSAIGISSFSAETLRQDEILILRRFARVFEQAYIRFLDLQKSEAQAREARLEAALEKLRSRTMAMQNSRDVGDAIGMLFTELEKLGIVTLRCGVFIIEEEPKMLEVWTATSTPEGKVGQMGGRFSFAIHPMLEGAFRAWKQKEDFYTYELAGEELLNYFKILLAANPTYNLPAQNLKVDRQFSYGFFFNEGALFTFTAEPHTTEHIAVMKRFAAVFGLTYRRYLDLKIAEEQTRQTIRQASIDRLRAEIASMRSTEDLQHITPLLWRELHALRVSFVRCGVFIVDEPAGSIHAYLSSPQGQSRGLLKMQIAENAHTRLLYDNWRRQVVYSDHWNREQLIAWLSQLMARNKVGGMETYKPDADLPGELYLHFVPFAQGMLYVGDTAPLADEQIQLVKALAEAFAIAYARYEDFRQLEEAKNKLETTLSELKAAQRQLIQAEKMASLGELTAGIAHEIQNPLNFINNFSEVSAELVNELEEALQADKKEATLLAADIRENLEKINHHGKRAEAIVNGMLLHSRSTQGEKTLTDINALAEEYLRLSYHGLRAKDGSFQASFTTTLDPAIEKRCVAPQDLGRALLNLFNNAFYAVNEKKQHAEEGYDPIVSLRTCKTAEGIEIAIADNGTGIPQRMLDKIFQPFFTTKPTGQGTGLGLSLSYDIIKGHGGDLLVETSEGEGTVFKIILPAKTN